MTATFDPVRAQHMRALDIGNAVRQGRAALKRDVRDRERTIANILADVPRLAERMPVGDLITAQHQWGRKRMRQFLEGLKISESTELSELTGRQRERIIDGLRPCPSRPAVLAVTVSESPNRSILHLHVDFSILTRCGTEALEDWRGRRLADWRDRPQHQCRRCAASVNGTVLHAG